MLIQREGEDWHTNLPRERVEPSGFTVRIVSAEPSGDGVDSIYAEYEFPDATWTQTFLSRPLTKKQFEGALAEVGLKVDKSNSFTNLSAWDLAVNGLIVNGFDIYVFNLNTGGFDAHDFLTMDVNAPLGTFAVGYGTSGEGRHIKSWGTPFTEAGLEDSRTPGVPEPSSMLLLGSGFLSAIGIVRRRIVG